MEAQDEHLIKIPLQIDLDLLLTQDESVCIAGEERNRKWKALRRISTSVMPLISQYLFYTFKIDTCTPNIQVGGYYVRDPSIDLTTKIIPDSTVDEIWISMNAVQTNIIDGKPKKVLIRSVTRNSPLISSCDLIGEIVTAPVFEDDVQSMKNNEENASTPACKTSFSMAERVWNFENFASEWDKHNLCEGDKSDSTGHFDELKFLPTPKQIITDQTNVTNPVMEHGRLPGENPVLEHGPEVTEVRVQIETIEDITEELELEKSNRNEKTYAENDALQAASTGSNSNESEQNELMPRIETTEEQIDGSKECKEIGGQEGDRNLAVLNAGTSGHIASFFRKSLTSKLRLPAPSVHPNSNFKNKLLENMNLKPPSSFIRLKFDEIEGAKKKSFLALPVAGTSRDGVSFQLNIDENTIVHLYPLKVTTKPLLGLYKALRLKEMEKHWLPLPTNTDFQLLTKPISKALRLTAMTVIAEKMTPSKK
jgi:hypothetical protein